MGIDFGKVLADATKGVSDFIGKASRDITKAVDQNGDGKLDITDIHVISDRYQAERTEIQRKNDLNRLKPLFPDDFESAEFVMPKLIRIGEVDKPHAENPVCQGSVGFRTVSNDMSAITIYRDFVTKLGLSFYPELDDGVYYADPCDRDQYIALEDYYTYMKLKRVTELQQIAQSLGAKHFKVTYKEKSKTTASQSVNASASGKNGGDKAETNVSHSVSSSELSDVRVEAEMRFPGHAPIRPELRYLKKDINIVNLVDLRMDPLSPLEHQRFNIEMGNSSGLKAKDAAKIDAMLKVMKIGISTTVESEAHNEERRILEYEIEF